MTSETEHRIADGACAGNDMRSEMRRFEIQWLCESLAGVKLKKQTVKWLTLAFWT